MICRNNLIFVVLPHAPPAIWVLGTAVLFACSYPHWAEPEPIIRQSLTTSPRSGDFLRPVSLCGCDYSRLKERGFSETRPNLALCRNCKSSPDLGGCSGHALTGSLSNDHWPRGWYELVQDKGKRRVGTYLNQRRAGNEVILKECRQYSVQIPRPNVRILASRSMGRSRSNLAALRICIAGSPVHLCKHWNPSRPELTFGRHREQTAYTGTPSLWLTLRVFPQMEHKKRAPKNAS